MAGFMISDEELYALLEEVFQPREDYFSIERLQPLLVKTIEHLATIAGKGWENPALLQLAKALCSGQLPLASQPGKGEKGIRGTNPVHGALFKLTQEQSETKKLDSRLLLLAHIINAAFQWRNDMQAADLKENFIEQREKRLKPTTYLRNLEAACKVVRLIEADWLDFLAPLDQSTEELRKRCDAHAVDEGEGQQQDNYIKQLGRFFAYALNKRQPRRGYQEATHNSSEKTPTVQRKRRFDDDLDDSWKETATSVITLPPDLSEQAESELRTSGLSTTEERPTTELSQSDQPIKAAKGDSSLQAVFRARSQQTFLDKAAQLLPGRWEQLSSFDLCQLMQQLSQHPKAAQRRQLGCVIGLLLMTGRSLESVLNAQIVKRHKWIPNAITDQSIYVRHGDQFWVSGIYRPENSRQLTGEWPHHMRKTQKHMALPIVPFCWQLMGNHAHHIAQKVKKRSVSLFANDDRAQLESELKSLLTETNRKTGSRLTAHRLSTHLFNTLNQGDADLTAACLITARVPSFGQQASLYYYAPSAEHLTQRYIHAMETIKQQWLGTFKPTTTDPFALSQPPSPNNQDHDGRPRHVGSQLVPKTAYVERLVSNMLQHIKRADKTRSLPHALLDFHNAYTAYTIAMLMFCTGYRSIRDPLPRWDHISLSRRMIAIADKTDDRQSHARFLPLPDIMVTQLQYYLRHRDGVTGRLQLFLQEEWETPFMFLDHHGHPKQVTPKRLQDQLNWPGSPPLNINRHYLHTQLKESSCCSELVDAFMGHWDAGQEPWANYSTFCPREYCNHITPVIAHLMQQQGWKALQGVPR
ncbi:hypothetical protein VRRI112168_00730 [Vreelandella rituensis]|uniref:Uncharacterized protein n=1 Tax=Vreelandella rituensis TaxID=2282306 RepID=A0A368UA36_9GAMM|nr:hypothetical protein [Halomonas rituensis]RCV93396.1 hypothetical protein DU506_01880 [Halomonas rituensis]